MIALVVLMCGLSLALYFIGTRQIKIVSALMFLSSVAVFIYLNGYYPQKKENSSITSEASKKELLKLVKSDADLIALMPSKICFPSRDDLGLHSIFYTALKLKLWHSLKVMEMRLASEIAANESLSPDLVSCYIRIAEAITSIPDRSNFPPLFEKITSYKRQFVKYTEDLNAISQMQKKIDENESLQNLFDAAMKDIIFMGGTIVAEHDLGVYEIRDGYGRLAVLRTSKTQFSSRGKFYLYVKKEGSFSTKTSRLSGGFTVDVPVYVEAPIDTARLAEIQEYKEMLPQIKKNIEEAKIALNEDKNILRAFLKHEVVERLPASSRDSRGQKQ